MKRFNIQRIRLTNFKGFPSLDLDMSAYGLAILGGKNGNGKTTLFDALELVFTGRISRLIKCKVVVDERMKYSRIRIPLVCDETFPEVSVEVQVSVDGSRFWLRRAAKVEEMTNPIRFEVFSRLEYAEFQEEDSIHPVYREIGREELESMLPAEFLDRYAFIHYLDQEEAGFLLRDSLKNRKESLSRLFDTESFEQDLATAKQCDGRLKVIEKEYEGRIKGLEEDIRKCEKSVAPIDRLSLRYVRLTNSLPWDEEKPDLTPDMIDGLFRKDGVFDRLEHYVRHKDEYRKYLIWNTMAGYGDEARMRELAEYVFYYDRNLLNLHHIYRHTLLDRFNDLNYEKLPGFTHSNIPEIEELIGAERLSGIDAEGKAIFESFKRLGLLQKEYSDMADERNRMLQTFSRPPFDEESRCPMCGHDYEERYALLRAIERQERFIKDSMGRDSLELEERFRRFKEKYHEIVLKPLEAHLYRNGYDDRIFELLDDKAIPSMLRTLGKEFGITINKGDNFDATYSMVKAVYGFHRYEPEEGIRYDELDRFVRTELKSYLPDQLTEENVKAKKEYLLDEWHVQSSVMLVQLRLRMKRAKGVLGECKSKRSSLKKLSIRIKDAMNAYLKTLVSDIQILFYIYSGRLMQDCHYGRGVFLKYDDSRVMFVTGNPDSDVDALFNMSSGQLSAITVAFTLALNKLYSKVGFIAIDDPVQTMDDMNFWGLTETLRHEFRDTALMLSTHEEQYGSLLKYKASKLGLDAHYFDARDFRK